MLMLILGLVIWWAAHLFKRAAPDRRAAMGDGGRGMVAILLLVSVIVMVLGYRAAGGPVWWGPSPMLKGLNNLLVLVGFYLFAAAGMKTAAGRRLRHPQLIGFALWAFAHLLPNGDLPSLVLFGGLLVWALVEMAVINRAAPQWSPDHAPVVMRKEVMAAAGALLVYLVVGVIHIWLGPNPFGA